MYALRERRVHVTQEDFELAVAKVRENTCVTISYALFFETLQPPLHFPVISSICLVWVFFLSQTSHTIRK